MPPPITPCTIPHRLPPYLGEGVVAPDGGAADAGVELAALERQLALGAVLIHAGQLHEGQS